MKKIVVMLFLGFSFFGNVFASDSSSSNDQGRRSPYDGIQFNSRLSPLLDGFASFKRENGRVRRIDLSEIRSAEELIAAVKKKFRILGDSAVELFKDGSLISTMGQLREAVSSDGVIVYKVAGFREETGGQMMANDKIIVTYIQKILSHVQIDEDLDGPVEKGVVIGVQKVLRRSRRFRDLIRDILKNMEIN